MSCWSHSASRTRSTPPGKVMSVFPVSDRNTGNPLTTDLFLLRTMLSPARVSSTLLAGPWSAALRTVRSGCRTTRIVRSPSCQVDMGPSPSPCHVGLPEPIGGSRWRGAQWSVKPSDVFTRGLGSDGVRVGLACTLTGASLLMLGSGTSDAERPASKPADATTVAPTTTTFTKRTVFIRANRAMDGNCFGNDLY